MQRKRQVILIGVLVAIAVTVAVLAGIAFAETVEPSVEVVNTGGVPKTNTKQCEYTLKFETCTITIRNNSSFPVKIVEKTITGPNPSGRYSIFSEGCTKGTEIGSGGFCEDQIRLRITNTTCNKWLNGYYVELAQAENLSNKVTKIAFLEVEAMNPPLEES